MSLSQACLCPVLSTNQRSVEGPKDCSSRHTRFRGGWGCPRGLLEQREINCSLQLWMQLDREGACRGSEGGGWDGKAAGKWRGPRAQQVWQARQEITLVPFVGPVSWSWRRRAGILSAWQIVQARCVAETEENILSSLLEALLWLLHPSERKPNSPHDLTCPPRSAPTAAPTSGPALVPLAHSAAVTLPSLPFLQLPSHAPTPGPLHMPSPPPGMLCPSVYVVRFMTCFTSLLTEHLSGMLSDHLLKLNLPSQSPAPPCLFHFSLRCSSPADTCYI